MSTTTTFADYVDTLSGLPEENFLGTIVMMTIHNLPTVQPIDGARITLPGHTGIDRATMEAWFVELGLDERHLRPEIRPAMAFANATGKESTCRYDLGMETELTWVDVSRRGDRERTVRHLMRRTIDRDAQGARVDECVAEMVFFHNGPSVKVNVIHDQLSAPERPIVTGFVQQVAQRYEDLCRFYTNNAIRWTVREQTQALNALKLAASGSYFVHQNRQATVVALATLVSRCPDGSSYHTIPLLDNPYQRERLTEALELEVEAWGGRLLDSVSKAAERVNDGGTLTPAAYQKLGEELRDAMDRAEEHTRLLDRSTARSAASLEAAMLAVAKLEESVDWWS